ncbi:NAD(P)H-quinone oxidoreductase [uncultured Paenalcaligenes sp.]|uniref:NAD(P)H-quinone oxidoreductase n=1 Tax=uncultured Paenalcaligenes sp. TaxID=1588925 RepID=UPI0026229C92|nr:NAD(P)H-quinone oxidoreductase [uncultured Paenalcaligenes sp.]
MLAIEITTPGGPEVLKPVQRPLPKAAAGQVLIKVEAAGINRPDVFQRKGAYPAPAGASDLPGLEVSGTIVEGDLAGTDFKIGDAVCALLPGGGYAQYALAQAEHCLPVPNGFSMVEAAGIPETFFTVYSNIWMRGQLQKGETLLVHGGASGIGTTAIQLAVAMGHTVFATVGSDERVEAVEKLGAIGINYKTQQFEQVVNERTNNKGVDVILDMVAGDYLNRDLACLADDGRIVVIALLGGAKGEVDAGQILRRRLTITGSTLRPRPNQVKADIAAALHKNVWPLLVSGQVKPLIHATFSLDQADQAHALMDSGEQIGKIILTV